jgi:XrtJ-associated TM-motif-TM protein
MKKHSLLFAGLAMMLIATVPVHAQGGCVNSPENPTVVLALVGSAGAFLASARARMRARSKARRNK